MRIITIHFHVSSGSADAVRQALERAQVLVSLARAEPGEEEHEVLVEDPPSRALAQGFGGCRENP